MDKREYTYLAAKEFFQVSLITYVFILCAEALRPGIVSAFFPTSAALALVVILGLIAAASYPRGDMSTPPPKTEKRKHLL